MKYPTTDEIKAAHDGITRDGAAAPATMELCSIALFDPRLRETVERLVAVGKTAFSDHASMPPEAFVASCIASGMNHALRIAEIRAEGVRTRAEIENLLSHYQSGQCLGKPECNGEGIRTLQWVLGYPS